MLVPYFDQSSLCRLCPAFLTLGLKKNPKTSGKRESERGREREREREREGEREGERDGYRRTETFPFVRPQSLAAVAASPKHGKRNGEEDKIERE